MLIPRKRVLRDALARRSPFWRDAEVDFRFRAYDFRRDDVIATNFRGKCSRHGIDRVLREVAGSTFGHSTLDRRELRLILNYNLSALQ